MHRSCNSRATARTSAYLANGSCSGYRLMTGAARFTHRLGRDAALTPAPLAAILLRERPALCGRASLHFRHGARGHGLGKLCPHLQPLGERLPAHRLHHVAYRLELFDELTDIRGITAGAPRDPPPARHVNNLGIGLLPRCHRLNNRFHPVQLLLRIDIHVAHHVADARNLLHQLLEGAHLSDFAELRQEIIKRELAGRHLGFELLGLSLVVMLLCLFDE